MEELYYPTSTKKYVLEELTERLCTSTGRDGSLVRLPVGHSQLNAIELIWALVKTEVAKKNTTFKLLLISFFVIDFILLFSFITASGLSRCGHTLCLCSWSLTQEISTFTGADTYPCSHFSLGCYLPAAGRERSPTEAIHLLRT